MTPLMYRRTDLGALTASDVWTPTKTRKDDTLATLASAYGVSQDEIYIQNTNQHLTRIGESLISRAKELGINTAAMSLSKVARIVTENDVNQWVASIAGSRVFAFVPGTTTSGGPLVGRIGQPPAGYAVFTADTSILLPARARGSAPTVPSVTPTLPPVVASTRNVPPWLIYGTVGAGAVLLLWTLGRHAKKAKKSGAPVISRFSLS